VSDNHRRHSAIKAGLMQCWLTNPTGRQAQYLNVLIAMISGLVGARNAHLSSIAGKVPSTAKRESQIKQFSRLVQNERVDQATYFAPFARALLNSLAHTTLVLALDASAVGQGCVALLVNVVHQGRALPLGYVVVKGKKGHLSEQTHLEALAQVQPLIPSHAQVVVVADGEFDGQTFLSRVQSYGWYYVCRTAKNSWLWLGDDQTNFAGLALLPGSLVEIPATVFTKAEYGPVLAVGLWQKGYVEPLYLVTNLELGQQALHYYRRRFSIETFFSDCKSRGFRLERSHLSDPARLGRLLIAACLAYLWLVYLGTVAKLEGWDELIHRTDRTDLSLFSLGLALLDHFTNHTLPIPVAFIPFCLTGF
jgi:hypothetical protein